MPKQERRFSPPTERVELRASEQGQTIVGYAAVYYDGTPGTEYDMGYGMVERMMPGAFDRAIREDDVRSLFNHNPDQILGRNRAGTLIMTSDAKGLRYEVPPPTTAVGTDVLASVKRGDVTGSSIMFEALAVLWRKDGDRDIREIRDVRLWDVGPVTFPAYESTEAQVRARELALSDKPQPPALPDPLTPKNTARMLRAREVETAL